MEKDEVQRIGVDLDGHDGFRLVYFLVRLRGYCSSVRTYYTRNGFHLVGRLKEGLGREDSLVVRAVCGDDDSRVRLDFDKLRVGDVRFFDRLFEVRLKGGETYARREFKAFHGVES